MGSPGSIVSVRAADDSTVVIGRIEWSHAQSLSFDFDEAATPGLIQELIRALTYVRTSIDPDPVGFDRITVRLRNPDESAWLGISAIIAAPDTLFLTSGIDDVVGTLGNDTICCLNSALNTGDAIHGGEGTDTLQLIPASNGDFY